MSLLSLYIYIYIYIIYLFIYFLIIVSSLTVLFLITHTHTHTHRVKSVRHVAISGWFLMQLPRANCEVLLRAPNSQSGGWKWGMISADLREAEAESGFAPSPCCPRRGKHRGLCRNVHLLRCLARRSLHVSQTGSAPPLARSLSLSLTHTHTHTHTHTERFLWFWKYLPSYCTCPLESAFSVKTRVWATAC